MAEPARKTPAAPSDYDAESIVGSPGTELEFAL